MKKICLVVAVLLVLCGACQSVNIQNSNDTVLTDVNSQNIQTEIDVTLSDPAVSADEESSQSD